MENLQGETLLLHWHSLWKTLKQLLDYLELKKIILLGFSDGGNIAMMFTLKYPQYVKTHFERCRI